MQTILTMDEQTPLPSPELIKYLADNWGTIERIHATAKREGRVSSTLPDPLTVLEIAIIIVNLEYSYYQQRKKLGL